MKMIIDNKEIKIVNANTFFKRYIGLLGKKNIQYGMFFKNCQGIHTFFMRENIDVIFLDSDNKVVSIHRDVPKNQVITCPIKKGSVLELPQNMSKSINMNDILNIMP